MGVLSAILYFISQHPFWSILVVPIVSLIISFLVGVVTNRPRWAMWLMIIPSFYAVFLNVFVGKYLNSLFLSSFGITGSGVITSVEPTNSTLNDQVVLAYSVVLRTVEGEDIVSDFDTMTATISPISNAIYIPPQGERFVTRYIPGFPRNFVIMREESPYGLRIELADAMAPIQRAANQLAASPANRDFQRQYRHELTQFLTRYRDVAPPGLVTAYQAQLDALPAD